MHIRKNNGPNIETCGTPASIYVHEEYFPFSTTRYFLFDKKSLNLELFLICGFALTYT